MTGQSNLTAEPILEYFEPLYDFLLRENMRLKKEDEIRLTLNDYNVAASKQCQKRQLAEWDVITDINNSSKRDAFKVAIAQYAQFIKSQYDQNFRDLNINDYHNETIRRQIMYLKRLGINALNENQLNELSEAKAKMEKIYNNAVFCDYFKQNCTEKERLTLDPGTYLFIYIIIEKN